MRPLSRAFLATMLAGLLAAAPAQADFGLANLEATFTDSEGTIVTQAGTHPFALTISGEVNSVPGPKGWDETEGAIRDLEVFSPEGLAGDPNAVPTCATFDFLTVKDGKPGCADSSALGFILATLGNGVAAPPGELGPFPLYNLAPSPGTAAKLGFWVEGTTPVTIDAGLSDQPPYKVYAASRNTPQILEFFKSDVTLWGNPTDSKHNPERGGCILTDGVADSCPANIPPRPFLTMPRSCTGPLSTVFKALAWWTGSAAEPGPPAFFEGEALSQGMSGCAKLGFAPNITAQPTSRGASSPTGLDFALSVADEGLADPEGTAHADIAKAVVTLPEGMSVNPSQAEGLEVCSESQLARETSRSGPGDGCPQASKIGTIEVETPLLEDELLRGSLYVAEPYANLAGDSLIAVYVVIKDRELGIKVVQPLRVEPDPETGQLVTYSEDMPQLPFSEFRLHFREGGRSPLITPPGCGRFSVEAVLHPSTGGAPLTSTSSFEIVSGPNNGPCPRGAAPFEPGFAAGTLNNAAGAYSPFAMRLTREDGMQDLSRFSAILPPGVVGRIAGIPWCPEAGIAQARGRTGEHGGSRELADPSCPAASQIGRTVAGAGVGSQLTYVPGSLYLAGPFGGAPLSVVSITPAVAGPFDAGAVVVRVGLKLNPKTAVVEADGLASDPIPHILQGIPLNVRDLRVYTDRPAFTLNATSCEPSNALATLWGAGTPLDPRPETPVGRAARYQAAGCASLGFEPKLGIKLRGGVKRGAHPALRAHVVPRPGDANFSRAVVTLPRSAFLDQGHIRTICTRVQFAAGAGNGALCPPGARYGFARAWSPLLDAPLQGPVFLRSSDNNLPDLVVALEGPPSAAVEIELSARIDSVKGGIRSTFTGIPDAPVSRFILDMQGGKKGLIVNSRHLCVKPGRNRAKANLRGQNGRFSRTRPRVIATKCQQRRKAKRKRAKRSTGVVSHYREVRSAPPGAAQRGSKRQGRVGRRNPRGDR